MESRLCRLARSIVDAFAPRFCIRCGREGSLWCTPCLEAYQPTPPRAGCPFCQAQAFSERVCASCQATVYLDGITALGSYADVLMRETINVWKYHGDETVFAPVAMWIRQQGCRYVAWPHEAVISWVPLHAGKTRARGFDQAQFIAQTIARHTGREIRDLLVRKKATSAQASKKDRCVGELDGTFRVVSVLPPKAVVLCDDVFTSGATMDAAARALKEVGVQWVWGCVLAKS